jgi:hypothetical protein
MADVTRTDLSGPMRVILGLALILHLVVARAAKQVPVCGTWQDEYTTLHNSILERKAPQRYAVAVSTFQGRRLD